MPLIKGVTADNYFLSVGAAREDEAVGMMTGAHMAGLRGAAMMQTSGFALVANAGQTPRDPTLIRSRFMTGLGTGRGACWRGNYR